MNTPVRNLKVVKIGNSAGVVLPRELLSRLGVQAGDQLSVAELDDRIELRPVTDDFEAQMAAAREVMVRRRRALRELAK